MVSFLRLGLARSNKGSARLGIGKSRECAWRDSNPQPSDP